MIESPAGVQHIDEILQVPGVGAVHVGASDLGVSLGVGPPSPDNPPGNRGGGAEGVARLPRAQGRVRLPRGVRGDAEVKRRVAEGSGCSRGLPRQSIAKQ